MASRAFDPLLVALCATAALSLLAGGGRSCNFAKVIARSGETLGIEDTSQGSQTDLEQTTIGIFCQGGFYRSSGDSMWTVSHVFFFLSAFVAVMATGVAWIMALSPRPSRLTWSIVSLAAALCAVLQIPLFLMFATKPCRLYKHQQECSLGVGSYLNISSIAACIVVTVVTRCLNPPTKVSRADPWRILDGDDEEQKQDPTSSRASDAYDAHSITSSFYLASAQVPEEKDAEVEPAPPTGRESVPTFAGDEEEGLNRIYTLQTNWEHFDSSYAYREPFAVMESHEITTAALGSLAPTVIPITGDDSILDSAVREEPKVQSAPVGNDLGPPAEDKREPRNNPDLSSIFRKADGRKTPSKRRRKVVKGYALMDDADIESSFPLSPPLEILTVALSKDFENDPIAVVTPSTQNEHELLDNWCDIHNFTSRVGTVTSEEEPEPVLHFSDMSDDDTTATPDSSWLMAVSPSANEEITEAEIPQRVSQLLRRKRKRRKKRRGLRSSKSVGSTPSLLDLTIDEESADDIDVDQSGIYSAGHGSFDYDPFEIRRTRSAPHLAQYSAISSPVETMRYDNLRMTGVNSYQRLQTFRTGEVTPDDPEMGGADEDRGRLGGWTMSSLTRRRPVSISPSPPRSEENASTKKSNPVSKFREERQLLLGIHAPATNASDSSDEDDQSQSSTPSQKSREARRARLQKMQQTWNDIVNSGSVKPLPARRLPSRPEHPDRHSGALNKLDLALAQLRRAHGVEYGPEEASL